jgi:serine/threonine protein kinase
VLTLEDTDIDALVYYIPPEVLNSRTTSFKGDVWSVGCVVEEMVSGRRVWDGLEPSAVRLEVFLTTRLASLSLPHS